MLNATKEFTEFLKQYKIHYCIEENTESGNDQISIKITGDTLSDFKIYLIFDSNNQIVYIRIWDLFQVSSIPQNTVLSLINAFNDTYRFVRFWLNTDKNTIDVFIDAFIQSGIVGKTCMNLCLVAAKICDAVYSRLLGYLTASCP